MVEGNGSAHRERKTPGTGIIVGGGNVRDRPVVVRDLNEARENADTRRGGEGGKKGEKRKRTAGGGGQEKRANNNIRDPVESPNN